MSERLGMFVSVAGAIARRNLKHAFKNPALLLPSILFPLVFLVAFAGGLSRIGSVPGFDFPSGYTAFQFVFVFLQAATFGGLFTGFAIGADFESGFARRLLLSAPERTGIVAGYIVSGLVRFLVTGTVITVAALLAGMQVGGSGVDLVGLVGLGVMVNILGTLWSVGLFLRARTVQAGPAMQIPAFLVLFLAPVYVPLHLLQGWIHDVARYNPATAFLTAGRGFISGGPDKTAIAFAVGAALILLFLVWAIRGLRSAETAG
jgi:ABC-2 type transport system permease protein